MSTTKTPANKSVKPFRSNSSPFLSPHEYEKGLQSKFMEQILFYFLSSNNNVSRKVSISIDKVSPKKHDIEMQSLMIQQEVMTVLRKEVGETDKKKDKKIH